MSVKVNIPGNEEQDRTKARAILDTIGVIKTPQEFGSALIALNGAIAHLIAVFADSDEVAVDNAQGVGENILALVRENRARYGNSTVGSTQ